MADPTPLITADDVTLHFATLMTTLKSDADVMGAVTSLAFSAIAAAEREFEEDMRVTLRTRRYVSSISAESKTAGTDYDEVEDLYDYFTSSYPQRGHFTLRNSPVQSVQSVKLMYGSNMTLIEYPSQWIRVNRAMGNVSIVPALTNVSYMAGAFILPLLNGGALNHVVPQIVSIDYTAGIPDVASNYKWAHLRLALAQRAALTILPSVAEMVSTAASRDGVSTQFGEVGKRQAVLQNAVDKFKADFTQHHAPIIMAMI